MIELIRIINPVGSATSKAKKLTLPQGLTVVGIGASAGGLSALSFFFDALSPDTGMSSILIVEDHVGFANAIQRLLKGQRDLEIVGVVPSGEEALKILRGRKVDPVLVDVSLPTMNGIDLVQQIHTEFPHPRCLILSGHMTPMYVKRSLDVGASGYILKDDVDGILEGIQRALDGEVYVSEALRGNK